MAKRPSAEEKTDAPAMIPSTYRKHDARVHDVQRERGEFIMLAVDIDEGNPAFDKVLAATEVIVGADTEFLIYSTGSSTADDCRWRVLVPLLVSLPGDEFVGLQKALFSLFADHGIQCCNSLARTAQPVFLPNVPPDRRGPDGLPLFYAGFHRRGEPLDLTPSCAIVVRCIELYRREREERERAAEEAKRRHEARQAAGDNTGLTPTQWYNENHSVEALLLQYGYKHDRKGNWRSPHQETPSYATRITDDGLAFTSLSGSDRGAGLGAVAKSGACIYGDPYDLFCHYEHGGDHSKAWAAIRRMMPREEKPSDSGNADGAERGGNDEPETQRSRFMRASEFDGKPVPARQSLVEGWIPLSTVTLFSGDGGTGKSLAALQLCCSTALGRPWFGMPVNQGQALFIPAEDDLDEVHRRLSDIARAEQVSLADMHRLTIRSLAGEDALLAHLDNRSGKLSPTDLLHQVERVMDEVRPKVVLLDTLADLFPEEENQRSQARQFIGMLRGPAIKFGAAVVVLAHPSLTGISSGTGTSGSTGWSNSVRSRLYLERIANADYEANPDARRLSVKKANYGRVGTEVLLTWRNGVFVAATPENGVDQRMVNSKAERVFLALLQLHTEQGRDVSPRPSTSYAPKVFAAHPKSEGITNRAFARAMEDLLSAKKIVIRKKGPKSRERCYIALATGGQGAAEGGA